MGNYLKERLPAPIARTPKSHIPYHNEPIIRATCKDIGVHLVPCHIFYRRTMVQYFHDGSCFIILLFVLLHIPNAYPFITLPGCQVLMLFWVPTQTIPLAGMTNEFRGDLVVIT